jgi:hypothetical protein
VLAGESAVLFHVRKKELFSLYIQQRCVYVREGMKNVLGATTTKHFPPSHSLHLSLIFYLLLTQKAIVVVTNNKLSRRL